MYFQCTGRRWRPNPSTSCTRTPSRSWWGRCDTRGCFVLQRLRIVPPDEGWGGGGTPRTGPDHAERQIGESSCRTEHSTRCVEKVIRTPSGSPLAHSFGRLPPHSPIIICSHNTPQGKCRESLLHHPNSIISGQIRCLPTPPPATPTVPRPFGP